jgi:hypothetical protein
MSEKTSFILVLIFAFSLMGCTHKIAHDTTDTSEKQYISLPENLIAFNDDSTISARYVDPTGRYNHGILGDTIEAGGLLVIKNKKEYYYKLAETNVFEDLRPKLKDVDNDGEPEFITIQTHMDLGASVCIYKIVNGKFLKLCQSSYIGQTHRWLNIAAIDDLDNDGNIEVAWIQTPHIGGLLKIARVEGDSLQIVDEIDGVSNHQIGSRNLCLAVVTFSGNQKIMYVPDNSHTSILGFIFLNNHITSHDTIILAVNPSIPLFMQYNFPDISRDENCIYVRNRNK